jgi:hypothetical protein
MATEIYLVKRHGRLVAFGLEDAEKIAGLAAETPIKAVLSLPRNVRFHRKFFALLNMVMDNMPDDLVLTTPDGQALQVRTVDDLLWHIKMQAGHYEQRVTLGGRVTYEAKSISFAAMDEGQFNQFYDDAIKIICKYFLPHVTAEEIADQIMMDF